MPNMKKMLITQALIVAAYNYYNDAVGAFQQERIRAIISIGKKYY